MLKLWFISGSSLSSICEFCNAVCTLYQNHALISLDAFEKPFPIVTQKIQNMTELDTATINKDSPINFEGCVRYLVLSDASKPCFV